MVYPLKRRSWFGRLLQVPRVFLFDYIALRKSNGRLVSIWTSLLLASSLLDQQWFWTKEWQQKEAKVDEDIINGRYTEFATIDEFIESLPK